MLSAARNRQGAVVGAWETGARLVDAQTVPLDGASNGTSCFPALGSPPEDGYSLLDVDLRELHGESTGDGQAVGI